MQTAHYPIFAGKSPKFVFMKTVILIRHAKSDWNSPFEKDFDRPLNARGNRDAPVMAGRLTDKMPQVDALISSPATRALSTAEYFADAYGYSPDQIIRIPELYHANAGRFYEIIENTDDRFNNIIVFSHNVGITDFVNSLTSVKIDSMPTCGMFGIRIPILSWTGFRAAGKNFWFFDYPKNNS